MTGLILNMYENIHIFRSANIYLKCNTAMSAYLNTCYAAEWAGLLLVLCLLINNLLAN